MGWLQRWLDSEAALHAGTPREQPKDTMKILSLKAYDTPASERVPYFPHDAFSAEAKIEVNGVVYSCVGRGTSPGDAIRVAVNRCVASVTEELVKKVKLSYEVRLT